MPILQPRAVCTRPGSPAKVPRLRGRGQRPAMNSPPAACVLPGMYTHKPERPARRARGGEDDMRNTPGERRRCWLLHRHRDRGPARRRPGAAADGGQTVAGAMQLAIGLLTASLDSPTLEAWAVWTLIPEDPAALGDCIAGLHAVSGLLLHELQDATGQPPAATLQKLAILAETRRGTPSAG
jgi:hypothetical protein